MKISFDPSTAENKTYPLPTEGTHQAVCVDVVDLGMVDQTWEGKTRKVHKMRLVWEIDETDPESGKPLTASQFYTASLYSGNGKMSKLRETLRNWRGRDFTEEEAKDFDPEVLIGQNCQVQVAHKPNSNGRTYANVVGVMKLLKGMVAMKPSDSYVRVKDRPPKDGAEPKAEPKYDDSVPF